MHLLSRPVLFILTLFPGAIFAATSSGVGAQRHVLANSIRTVSVPGGRADQHAYIARATLKPEEVAAPMKFEVALAMRNFEELETRLANREVISREELEARYLPLEQDYTRVRRWLEDEGFEITRQDAHHLALFARGSVGDVSRVLGATFARVASPEGEFTSAVTAPTVPNTLATTIRGIHGLQPHIRLRRSAPAPQPLSLTTSNPPFTPAQISHAYHADTLGLTGAGQTIAVYSLGTPANSDLTNFWTRIGSSASLANIVTVPVAGGPAASQGSGYIAEATLDVEWASALAPGATIRLYAASENDAVADDELIQEILADLPNNPTIHQLTISYGYPEDAVDRDYLAIEAQYMAALVSSGVTVFASSGDTGALPDSSSTTNQVNVPASMPDVTAVGGTALSLSSTLDISSETAWGSFGDAGKSGSSGGGVSGFYTRPAWQNVAGAPAGNWRLVPDVAAAADPNTGAYIILNGRAQQIGGTSWSSPTWAAFCAMLNQSRAATGKPPLGAMNPRLYALAGTDAFRDVTSGGNSVYQAGVGYDLITGLGSPNVAALLAATTADNYAPTVEIQSGDRFTTPAMPTTFYVIATGAPTPSFRWQRRPAGGSNWTDLTDGAAYSGTATYALVVNSATLAMSGDQFRCVVANSAGTLTSATATLTVANFGVATLAGWPGWSGYADGRGSIGRFNFTGSVRTDDTGTIYIADASNNTIRKILSDGTVSTLAGAPGVAGATDGPLLTARFNGPAGVAIDHGGNIFVADSQNYTIRRISAAGTVSTFAGTTGSRGVVDGTGTSAKFYDPQNLTIDAVGNLYVADGKGNCVRKVTPGGVVTTLAGSPTAGTADGTGAAAGFDLLAGVAVDNAGNVYVGDYNNNAVRKITPAGVVTTLAGLPGKANHGFKDGTGATARFFGPTGLCVDAAGNVIVADSFNNAIRIITPTGIVTTLAGSASQADNVDGPFAAARFNNPADVAVAPDGVFYVADGLNCTLRRITVAPAIATNPAPQSTTVGGTLNLSVVVTGTGPYAYQWSKDGTAIAGATSATLATTVFSSATAGSYSVAVTTPSGTLNSTAALVSVAAGTNTTTATLTNLAVRTTAGGGDQTLIAGFVIRGTPGKPVLVRAVGPGLAPLGVTGTIVDPSLAVVGPNSSTTLAASNDNWNSSDATLMASLGAFGLPAGSKDAAVTTTLSEGQYSAKVTDGAGGTGIALAEIYDAAPGGARLINLSARAQVGTGGGVLIAGFTISGSGAKTLLIRGIGPSLGVFGVGGALADAKLEVFHQGDSAALATNDNWDGTAATSATFDQVGAFGLAAGSKDAALILTLAPGVYSAVVSGLNNTTGVGLVEIYEIP